MSIPLPPPIPEETLRLALLRSTVLVESPREPFDRISRLAAALLNAPMAAICLIDERDSPRFESCVGFEPSQPLAGNTFCLHVVRSGKPIVVADASRDERFHDDPLIVGPPSIRFFAAVPFFSSTGIALGTLCVLDRQPRAQDSVNLAALSDLTGLLGHEVVHREASLVAKMQTHDVMALLEKTELRFKAIFEQAGVGIAVVSPKGTWLRVNRKLADIVGYSPSALSKTSFQAITHPDDLDLDMRQIQACLDGRISNYQIEKRYLRPDGSAVWTHLTASLVRNAHGMPDYFIAVVEDIQARKQAEASLHALQQDLEHQIERRTQELIQANAALTRLIEQSAASEAALRASEAELRAVLAGANDAYVSMEESGTIVEWNRMAENTFGWRRDEAVGRRITELVIPPEYLEHHRHVFLRLLRAGKEGRLSERLELTMIDRAGRRLPVEMGVFVVRNARRRLYCAFLRDISERKAFQRSLELQARRDALTGLANRRELMDRLEGAIAHSRRHGRSLIVLFLDLDDFKAINDRFGHAAGDEVLREFARRLQSGFRRNDIVARLAGDEFVVVSEPLTEDDDAARTAARIQRLVDMPFEIVGGPIPVKVSVGIATLAAEGAESAEALLAAADADMYRAKQARALPEDAAKTGLDAA